MSKFARYAVVMFGLMFVVSGCRSAYYSTMEKFGVEKRHLLRDNVQKAQQEQQQASEEFKDVLTRIKAMYGFSGGELEKAYQKLKADYDDCQRRSDAIRKRMSNVEQIAADLFKEWEQEIQQIGNPDFRASSSASLIVTKERYARLHEAMQNAEARLAPVLQQLNDYVLYLKHNLNAQAIGALKKEVDSIELDVASLIRDMNTSIQEADRFLADFE